MSIVVKNIRVRQKVNTLTLAEINHVLKFTRSTLCIRIRKKRHIRYVLFLRRHARLLYMLLGKSNQENTTTHLIAEDFDLAVSAMEDRIAGGPRVIVGVYLDVEGQPLHPLLGTEVRAETVDGNVHLKSLFY